MRNRHDAGTAGDAHRRSELDDATGIGRATMLPSVSVPNDTVTKFAEAEAAEPELEPQGLRAIR